MKKKAQGDYASVNGLRIYYEVHGSGEPLILLHGGVGGLEMFGPNLLALAKARRVIAVDLQAHGRTADIDRPLRFELMSDDIAALIAHLRQTSCHRLSWSRRLRHSSMLPCQSQSEETGSPSLCADVIGPHQQSHQVQWHFQPPDPAPWNSASHLASSGQQLASSRIKGHVVNY